MKLLNKKQKNNKGFSLVELIVVIAIMVVLVAVLAPVFTRYIESSRRSTDVQNAASIGESVLADVADNATWYQSYVDGTVTEVKSGIPTAIKENVVTKGDAVEKGAKFWFKYTKADNKARVYVGSTAPTDITDAQDMSQEAGGTAYKNAE